MIRNGRVIAYCTAYVNNIYYNEKFGYHNCHIQGYSLFYWFKRNYLKEENMIFNITKGK